jgi:iron complex outermembrane receptor protein
VKFKLRTNIGWSLDDVAANLFVNYYRSYRNTLVTPVQEIPSYATADLHLGVTPRTAMDLFRNTTFSLDVTNLFNTDPPFVNVIGGYDPSENSAIGRMIGFTIAKEW